MESSINTNSTNISSNDTDIASNASSITTNASNISSNDTDIATINTSIGQITSGVISEDANNCNTGVGTDTLVNLTTGQRNSAFGNVALFYVTEADNNTATGYNAGYNLTTGSDNSIYGAYALDGATTVTQMAVGSQALTDLQSGSYNVGIGSLAYGATPQEITTQQLVGTQA